MVKRIMQGLHLKRIAAVDRPCQEGALVTIMKAGPGSGPRPGMTHRVYGERLFGRRRSIDLGDHASLGDARAAVAEHMKTNPASTDYKIHDMSTGGTVETIHHVVKAAPEVEDYLKRSFSDDKRKDLAATGAAMPDGGFPIENRSDLRNAVRAFGRAKNPAKAKAHIITRARALDATSILPADWKISKRELLADVTNDAAMEGFSKAVQVFKDEMIAVDFDSVQADAEAREYANGLLEEIDEAVCSLRTVFAEIGCDDAIADKDGALQESFDQFKAHIQGIVPEGVENALIAAALTEAGFEVNEGGALTKRDEDTMVFDIKKSLGLPATATDADVQKAMEARDLAAKRSETLLKMSGKHAAFMQNDKAKMPAGGKEAFADMSADERDKHMDKNPIEKSAVEKAEEAKAKKEKDDADAAEEAEKRAGDETISVGGVELRKSVIGEAQFAVIKSQQAEISKLADKDAVSTIEKRVAALKHIGAPDELAALIHGISKHDPKLGEAVEKKFGALEEQIAKGKLFAEIGGGGGGRLAKASDEIAAKAQELVTKGLAKTIFKARDMVRSQNPELAKQEAEETTKKAA